MAERDAMWLSKEQKRRIRELLELPEPKNADNILIELTDETRQPIKFRPCPDCGYARHPFIRRDNIYKCSDMAITYVKACCRYCGWETQRHKTVKECAKEWNEAEV